MGVVVGVPVGKVGDIVSCGGGYIGLGKSGSRSAGVAFGDGSAVISGAGKGVGVLYGIGAGEALTA